MHAKHSCFLFCILAHVDYQPATLYTSENFVMTLKTKIPKIPKILYVSIQIDHNILQEKVRFYR